MMNSGVCDEVKINAIILRAYNFESDNEDNINIDDLSDLSDVFEDDNEESSSKGTGSNINETAISLDDITYDRDLKLINVPNGGRTKPVILQSNHRLLKQVRQITNEASTELNYLDRHYIDMDDRKKNHDKKFLVEFDTDHSGRGRDGRPRRGGRARGRRERPEASGMSRMEEDSGVEGLDRGFDVEIVDREVKSSRRRGLGSNKERGAVRNDSASAAVPAAAGRRQEARGPRNKPDNSNGAERMDKVRRDVPERLPRREQGRRGQKPTAQPLDTTGEFGEYQPENLADYQPAYAHDYHAGYLPDYQVEREHADYSTAQTPNYNPYSQQTPVPAGRQQNRDGRTQRAERVHPRAVMYQHPNSSRLQAPDQVDTRNPRESRKHSSRDVAPASVYYASNPYEQQYEQRQHGYQRQQYDAYEPLDYRHANAHPVAAVPHAPYGYHDPHELTRPPAPTHHPHHLYSPGHHAPQPQFQSSAMNAVPLPPPQPVGGPPEPKLNAKAAEFVPTWLSAT